MKYYTLALIALLLLPLQAAKPSIAPDTVAILYNTRVPDSKTLAEYYAKQRHIPKANLIGLPLSRNSLISRKEYISSIEQPLRKHFTDKNWWKMEPASQGVKVATKNKIRVFVCMMGVPYGINPDKNYQIDGRKIGGINSATVDSELAALGIIGFPLQRALVNKYFKKDTSFADANLPSYMLVGRIDADKLSTCKRLIDDAIEVEKTGLWGMCYLDQAKKGGGYKMGDQWLLDIEKKNWQLGIPTTMDANRDTYLTNYPMRDAALYFGWYTTNFNGPFRNPNFKLKKGAIAVHLHSYSALYLRNPKRHWTGPLLASGACATVGNVYEPYLSGTHYFNILHDRLTKGYTFIEAAYMSINKLSWQNLVIGDPLYQPYKFLQQPKMGKITQEDKVYRNCVIGFKEWKDDPDTLTRKFRSAGLKTNDARYYEILGLYKRYLKDMGIAVAFFQSASKMYLLPADKTRCQLHIIDILRSMGKKDKAILAARNLLAQIKGTAEEQTVKSLLNILSPPPPPKAKPHKKIPTNKR